jgi:hypothetical protein
LELASGIAVDVCAEEEVLEGEVLVECFGAELVCEVRTGFEGVLLLVRAVVVLGR